MKIILLLLLGVFAFFSNTVFSQYNRSIIGEENYKFNSIIVATNRLSDSTLSSRNPVFLNQVDTSQALQYYKVTYMNGDFIMEDVDMEKYITTAQTGLSDWLLFVHGDGKTFIHAAARGLDIQNYHDINVIVFAWPSRLVGNNGGKHFKASLTNSAISIPHFEELLITIDSIKRGNSDYFTHNNFSAVFHSLGNRFLKLYAEKLTDSNFNEPIFNNLIFNAAAVNEKGHKEWIERIELQDNILNNSNMWDRNLNGLRIISKYKYLLGERLSMPLSDSVYYFNFTTSVGGKLPPGRSHTYFLGRVTEESPSIRLYYHTIFHGHMPDLDKSKYLMKRDDGFGYDVLF